MYCSLLGTSLFLMTRNLRGLFFKLLVAVSISETQQGLAIYWLGSDFIFVTEAFLCYLAFGSYCFQSSFPSCPC
ncbi:Uncharacterized protein TCM_002365 [Theobroma cacao]|uniref:Uncharacterized protein n=1 Tax=Theobroma cacao TaxID=3641 RepID=A0A061DL06_THECC|nr:Uncharacterized protein TCM_002365 [Theobroma cacao]